MQNSNYKTTIERFKKHKIKATQRIEDGYLQSGYIYCIEDGSAHIVDTGSVSCGKFSEGIPKEELIEMLKNHIKNKEE